MPKKLTRKLTLRQRLRADAETRLDKIISDSQDEVNKLLEGTGLACWDVMLLATGRKNNTLRSHLVSKLANEAEEELERIYNAQQSLPGVEDAKA